MSIAMQTSPTLLIIEDDPDNARSVDEAAQDADGALRFTLFDPKEGLV